MSKVPNCKDTKIRNVSLPGPGHYNAKAIKYGDPSELGSKAIGSTEASSLGQSEIVNPNPFMSATGRLDMWKNELSAPYTKATFSKNPGPG